MSRIALLGLLGLVLAVAVGFGVHLITRQTISLPVARLEQAPALAPLDAREQRTTETTTETAMDETNETTPEVTTEEDSGGDSGRGRGRGRGRGGDSGPGGDD